MYNIWYAEFLFFLFEIYLNLIHAIRLVVITFVGAHFYLGASFLWVYDVFDILNISTNQTCIKKIDTSLNYS